MLLDGQRQFQIATAVHMGRGVSATLVEQIRGIGATRVTVVTDPGVLATGMVERLLGPVRAAGIAIDLDDGVRPNQRDVDCEAGA